MLYELTYCQWYQTVMPTTKSLVALTVFLYKDKNFTCKIFEAIYSGGSRRSHKGQLIQFEGPHDTYISSTLMTHFNFKLHVTF